MEIILNEDYKITSDPLNVVVQRRTTDADGNKTDNFKPLAYCGTLQQACKFIVEKEIKVSEATSFQMLIDVIEGIYFHIENTLQPKTEVCEDCE